jgi:predicted nucleic acid-binding protein
MSAERFTLDTNILVYAADRTAGQRHELAVEIVDRAVARDCVLTIQALGEFLAASTRKGLASRPQAITLIRQWQKLFPLIAADGACMDLTLEAVERNRLAFWDALLLATAGQAGCTAVVSEDMADGARLGRVRVRHPFAGTGSALAIAPGVRSLLGMA